MHDAPDAPTPTPTASERGDTFTIRLPRVDRVLGACLGTEAVDHLRNARREQLLAMRSFLDKMITDTDTDARARKGAAQPTRRVEIRVD